MSTHSVQSAWWLCWNSCRFFLNVSSCYASKMPCLQIDEFEAGSPDACNEACFNTVICQYYTYSPESTDCLLYNSCQISEDVCEDCLTSEVACSDEGNTGGAKIKNTQEPVSHQAKISCFFFDRRRPLVGA